MTLWYPTLTCCWSPYSCVSARSPCELVFVCGCQCASSTTTSTDGHTHSHTTEKQFPCIYISSRITVPSVSRLSVFNYDKSFSYLEKVVNRKIKQLLRAKGSPKLGSAKQISCLPILIFRFFFYFFRFLRFFFVFSFSFFSLYYFGLSRSQYQIEQISKYIKSNYDFFFIVETSTREEKQNLGSNRCMGKFFFFYFAILAESESLFAFLDFSSVHFFSIFFAYKNPRRMVVCSHMFDKRMSCASMCVGLMGIFLSVCQPSYPMPLPLCSNKIAEPLVHMCPAKYTSERETYIALRRTNMRGGNR